MMARRTRGGCAMETGAGGSGESRTVVVVIFPHVASVDVSGPLEPFELANFLTGRRLYRPATASLDGAAVPVAGGFLHITPTYALEALPDTIDLLLVAGGPGCVAASQDQRLLQSLRALEPRCRKMGSICTGSTVLVASGVTNGHRVATHWYEAKRLQADAGNVLVDSDAIFTNSGKFWTSAGMLAGLDLALALIELDHGRQLALDVARFLVIAARRKGGQHQFSTQLRAEFTDDPRIRRVQLHIYENPSSIHSLKQLAERAAMSERNLLRTFKRVTRTTLGQYIEEVRLSRARELLERTRLGTQQVAAASGFGTAANLRRIFARRLAVSPSGYRLNFGAA